jgi:hypothetical protein
MIRPEPESSIIILTRKTKSMNPAGGNLLTRRESLQRPSMIDHPNTQPSRAEPSILDITCWLSAIRSANKAPKRHKKALHDVSFLSRKKVKEQTRKTTSSLLFMLLTPLDSSRLRRRQASRQTTTTATTPIRAAKVVSAMALCSQDDARWASRRRSVSFLD